MKADPSHPQSCVYGPFTQTENTRSGLQAVRARIGGKLVFTSHLFIFTMSLEIACTNSIFNSRWKALQAEELSREWVSQKWEKVQENSEKQSGQREGLCLHIPYRGSFPPTNTVPQRCNVPREYQSLAERRGLCPESAQMWGENSAGIKRVQCDTSVMGWSQHGCLMLRGLAKQLAALCPQIFLMKQRGGLKFCWSLPPCYGFLGMLWIF